MAIDAERPDEVLSAFAECPGEQPCCLWRPCASARVDLNA